MILWYGHTLIAGHQKRVERSVVRNDVRLARARVAQRGRNSECHFLNVGKHGGLRRRHSQSGFFPGTEFIRSRAIHFRDFPETA